nr:hypothetical protein [Burkholderia pyrrocinia]
MQSNSSGLTPAKAIQKNEAPLARRKPIQMNDALADMIDRQLRAV